MGKPLNINNIKVMTFDTYQRKMLSNEIGAYHWRTNRLNSKDFEDFKKYLINNRKAGLKGLTFYKLKYKSGNHSFLATFK